MVKTCRAILASFKIALSGLFYAFQTQKNLRIGLAFALLALVLSWGLRLTHLEFVLIFWAILIFFIAEMVNTSIEAVVNLVAKNWQREARVAKDIAAGMVLLTAVGTVILGLLIFGPHFREFFGF